ncbi:hypothetical protein ACT4S5_09545 [Kocuria oceani]
MSDDSRGSNSTRRTMLRAMRSTIGRESTTFGFSILVTAAFGVLQTLHGTPVMAEIFLYATGAVLSFTLLEGLLSRGFLHPMPQHHTGIQAMGTSLNILSVGLALAIALLIGTLVTNMAAWFFAPFIGSIVYLVLESAEIALAEHILRARGDAQADEVTP